MIPIAVGNYSSKCCLGDAAVREPEAIESLCSYHLTLLLENLISSIFQPLLYCPPKLGLTFATGRNEGRR